MTKQSVNVEFNSDTIDELKEMAQLLSGGGKVTVSALIRFAVYNLIEDQDKYTMNPQYFKNFRNIVK
jgi:hypothetical protein